MRKIQTNRIHSKRTQNIQNHVHKHNKLNIIYEIFMHISTTFKPTFQVFQVIFPTVTN